MNSAPTVPTPSTSTTQARRRLAALVCGLSLIAAACGSDDTSTEPVVAPSGTAMTDNNMDTDMDTDKDKDTDTDTDTDTDMDMNMGDPDATPAEDVENAALARGTFVTLETRPQGYDDVAGTAVIARSSAGTTVTTEMTGLLPNVEYIAHLHAEPCSPNNGGPHYQFEVGGATTPPNEIHLAFTSDAGGHGFMTAQNHMIAGVEAQSLIVHPVEFLDNKIACVDFVEDEAGATAAAIEAGAGHDDMESMTTEPTGS